MNFRRRVSGVLRLQLATAVVLWAAVLLVGIMAGLAFGAVLLACLYGSALGLAGAWLGARGVNRIRPDGSGMAAIFMALLNKLVVVGGGIGFGLVALGLSPWWVIIGYLVVQFGVIWAIIQPGPVAGASR